jgi:cytochrome d ubiquinol oxidase subunit II
MNSSILAGSAFILLGVFLGLYMLTTAIDVGGGLIALWARWRHHDARVGETILHYVSPVWEVSNVFIIAFIVGMVGFFPGSIAAFGTALFVPLAVALVLMLTRGFAFTWHYYINRQSWAAQTVAAGAGALVPVALVPFLALSDVAERVHGDSLALLAQPLTLALMLVAATSVPCIAAAFLAWYATRAGDADVAGYLRHLAQRTGIPLIGAAILLGLTLHLTAPAHAAATAHWWPLVVGAGMLFAASGWWLLWGTRPGAAFLALVGTVGLSVAAWSAGQWPYLLRPSLTATAALVNGPMYTALAITIGLGMMVVLPLLGGFYYVCVIRWSRTPKAA